MDLTNKTHRTIAICLMLGAATLITFWPQTGHDFVSYDDPFYLTENVQVQQGLTWETVGWALRTGAAGNWHPVTWLSHILDVQLFGLEPGWHHLTSLLFHTANAVLLFLLLQRMTGAVWRSAFVAGLFALHPLHVQSVAWVAERKDVLSAFFFMLTLGAYAKYVEKSKAGKEAASDENPAASNTPHASRFTFHALGYPPRSFYYVLALVLFALGLMSKPMLVTVPFVLLLLDYWPLRRFELDTRHSTLNTLLPLFLEKLPFFALSAGSCAVTLWAQTGGGAVVPMGVVSLPQRLANALAAYGGYLRKTFWPVDLAVLYPIGGTVPVGTLIPSGAVLIAVTAWVVWRIRRQPCLAVGWFWFVGMLVPVIGLVQVGMQLMADRYTYLPLIGLFVMVAWGVVAAVGVSPATTRWRLPQASLAVASSLVLVTCAAASRQEVGYWKDSEQLFGHALQVTPANYIALDNYARALLKQGNAAEAVRSFEAAVALRPDLDAARCGLGTALMDQGKLAEAAEQFDHVLEVQPDHAAARLQLGIIRGRQGRLEEAGQAFARVLRLHPEDAGAHNNLGNVLAQQGKHEEAVRQFEDAVRLRPDNAAAQNNLAISCRKLGRTAEAIAHYREALRLQPAFIPALNNLAWLLAAHSDAQFRNGTEAVQLATRACDLTRYESPAPLATLGAAYAEAGQFQEAVAYVERAQELAKGSQGPLAARMAAMLEAFRAGQPYRGD